MPKTTASQYRELALQIAKAIPTAANDTDRELLGAAVIRYSELAGQAEAEEMQADQARREFWAARRPMNWVS
jgi:hypothetical protein